MNLKTKQVRDNKMYQLKNSFRLYKKAKKIIPAMSQTFSKAPSSYVEGVYPIYLSKGKGSHVFDVDGNKYIDFVMALGPISLGYNYAKVDTAIKKQLKNGISFSMPHPLELELSEELQSIIPGAEMVRFSKTGSDAGTAAIRAARALTKRDNIAYCGSGGVWHDWFTTITSRNEGVPKFNNKFIKKFGYNDLESLKILFERWKGEVAAVYIEPMTTKYPKNNFLHKVKNLTHKNGAILVFDEVVTGFRLANGGAQELLKVEADLVAFGKGIANGMPLGAITGKSRFMEKFNDVFYSTSYGGETLSLAAAVAVVNEFKTKPVVKHCWKIGSYLQDQFNKMAKELGVNISLEGIPVRSAITCRDENGNESLLIKSLFCQEAVQRGVLFGRGYVLLCYSHTKQDIERTLNVCEISMKRVNEAIQTNSVKKSLKGKVMKPVLTF